MLLLLRTWKRRYFENLVSCEDFAVILFSLLVHSLSCKFVLTNPQKTSKLTENRQIDDKFTEKRRDGEFRRSLTDKGNKIYIFLLFFVYLCHVA